MLSMTWGARAAAALLFATAVAAPREASAAIYLSLAGSPPPVVDIDGVTGLADIAIGSSSALFVDVRYTSIGGTETSGGVGPGVIWGATFGLSDVVETAFGSLADLPPPASPLLTHLGSASDGMTGIFSWTVTGPLAEGTVLQTFALTTGAVGIWPHDDIGDLFLTGGTPAGGAAPFVFDPISGAPALFVNYDLQTVPLPVPAALLLTGLAGLIGLRRRRG